MASTSSSSPRSTTPSWSPTAIARVLPTPAERRREPAEHLTDYLADKHLLLLLDNFEQIIDAAPLVERAAGQRSAAARRRHQPGRRCTCTASANTRSSRSRCRLPDEANLASLMQSGAVSLFVDRARAVVPSFTLQEDNVPVDRRDRAGASTGCRSRSSSSPHAPSCAAQALLDAADEPARRRARARTACRLGTRRCGAAIEWSYDLLDDESQRSFAASPCSRAAPSWRRSRRSAPRDDVFDAARRRSSTGAWSSGPSRRRARFLMLETIRDFALERLRASGEEDGRAGAARGRVPRAGRAGRAASDRRRAEAVARSAGRRAREPPARRWPTPRTPATHEQHSVSWRRSGGTGRCAATCPRGASTRRGRSRRTGAEDCPGGAGPGPRGGGRHLLLAGRLRGGGLVLGARAGRAAARRRRGRRRERALQPVVHLRRSRVRTRRPPGGTSTRASRSTATPAIGPARPRRSSRWETSGTSTASSSRRATAYAESLAIDARAGRRLRARLVPVHARARAGRDCTARRRRRLCTARRSTSSRPAETSPAASCA